MQTIINNSLLYIKNSVILNNLEKNSTVSNPVPASWLQKIYKDSEIQDFWSLLTSSAN